MKKLILVAFLCFMASSAFAQSELPKAEIGFGYGFAVPLNSPSADMEALGIDYPNSHGWQAEAHIPFTPSFGIALMGSGSYISLDETVLGVPMTGSGSGYGFQGGPRYTYRARQANFYAQGLIGVVRSSAKVNFLDSSVRETGTAFVVSPGTGIEWNIRPDVAIVAPQVTYSVSRAEGTTGHGISIGAGVVFRIR